MSSDMNGVEDPFTVQKHVKYNVEYANAFIPSKRRTYFLVQICTDANN